MTTMTKLKPGQKHLLRMIAKEQNCPDGWAPVSKMLCPLIRDMPDELVEFHTCENSSGRARLTAKGEQVIEAMSWL